MRGWTTSEIPDQAGRLALVTGTGGLGFQVALAQARAGGDVVIAGRDPGKGRAAVDQVRRDVPGASVRFERVDLADLRSISALGERLRRDLDRLDLLVNNAAVMTPPQRRETADGFELQFGTNHLGHFALTAELLPLLYRGRQARVVTVSSVAARSGAIKFEDLQSERDYRPMVAYGQSKLANLMFALELQRRSEAAGWGLASIAAHPGIARTDLIPNGSGRLSPAGLARSLLWFLFQPAARGALPTLYAATAPEAQSGGYYGPDRWSETRGAPAPARVPRQATDLDAAQRLWAISEQLTGATFSDPRSIPPHGQGATAGVPA